MIKIWLIINFYQSEYHRRHRQRQITSSEDYFSRPNDWRPPQWMEHRMFDVSFNCLSVVGRSVGSHRLWHRRADCRRHYLIDNVLDIGKNLLLFHTCSSFYQLFFRQQFLKSSTLMHFIYQYIDHCDKLAGHAQIQQQQFPMQSQNRLIVNDSTVITFTPPIEPQLHADEIPMMTDDDEKFMEIKMELIGVAIDLLALARNRSNQQHSEKHTTAVSTHCPMTSTVTQDSISSVPIQSHSLSLVNIDRPVASMTSEMQSYSKQLLMSQVSDQLTSGNIIVP